MFDTTWPVLRMVNVSSFEFEDGAEVTLTNRVFFDPAHDSNTIVEVLRIVSLRVRMVLK